MATKKKEIKEKVAVEEMAVGPGPAFELPNEKVEIRFVKRQSGFITNPSHVAYGKKLEGATDTLPAKQDRSGQYVPILTFEEQQILERMLNVEEGYLSIHKALNNFWDTQTVKLGKESIVLDLSKPYDYIKYKMLLAYEDFVSPSIMETGSKRTYMYEAVLESDVNAKDKKTVDYNRQAYRLFGKIESSREQLAGVIRVLDGKAVATTDHDWLISEVGKIVDRDPKRFVETLTDKNYETKLFIEKAISKKEIVRDRGLYSTKNGESLCEQGESATLMNTINFLNNIKNQEIKLAIEAGF